MSRQLGSLALLGYVSVCACGPPVEHSSPAAAQGERGTQHSALIAPITTLADDNLTFATALYRTMALQQRGNLALSPYAAAVALAMLYTGAEGQTAQQIIKVTHWQEREKLASGTPLAALRRESLHQNTAVWVQEGLHVHRDYTTVLAMAFGTSLVNLDFIHGLETARWQINQWASRQTGESHDLLGYDQITTRTRLLVSTAVHLSADWAQPLSPAPAAMFAHSDGAEPQLVPMLGQTAHLDYFQGQGVTAVQIDSVDYDLALLLLLPDGPMEDLEASLSLELFTAIDRDARSTEVALTLPAFTLKGTVSLRAALMVMGMTDAFDLSRANFSGIESQHQIALENIVQQTAWNMTATQTAASGGDVALRAPPDTKVVQFNRPFMVILRDVRSGSPMFMARVENPT